MLNCVIVRGKEIFEKMREKIFIRGSQKFFFWKLLKYCRTKSTSQDDEDNFRLVFVCFFKRIESRSMQNLLKIYCLLVDPTILLTIWQKLITSCLDNYYLGSSIDLKVLLADVFESFPPEFSSFWSFVHSRKNSIDGRIF